MQVFDNKNWRKAPEKGVAMRTFIFLTLLLLAACGGGGVSGSQELPNNSGSDIILLFVSGHQLGPNDSYLHRADEIGPFLEETVRGVFPNRNVLSRYYRDGADVASTDGQVFGGSDQLFSDLSNAMVDWPDARVCVITHSHGGPRAMDVIRRIPSRVVHHMVLLDANSYGFDVGAHDDTGADEERIFGSSSIFRQYPVVASNTTLSPADDDRKMEGYVLHSLEQADVVPWNVWSCLEYRLREGAGSPINPFDNGLDRHWALRLDGSNVRITPRIALGDTHNSIHKPAESGTPAAVAAWLIEQLKTPISVGTFTLVKSVNLKDVREGVAVSDLNNDGLPDLLVSTADINANTGEMAILLGSRNGFLEEAKYLDLGIYFKDFSVADLDRDGIVDFVTFPHWPNGSIKVYYGLGNANFSDPVEISGVGVLSAIGGSTLVDVNGDQYLDIVTITIYWGVHAIYNPGMGSRNWNSAPVGLGELSDWIEDGVDLNGSGTNVLAEDFNGDGVCDLIVTEFAYVDGPLTRIFCVLGRLNGVKTEFDFSAPEELPSSIYAAYLPTDVDGDGDLDLVGSGITNSFDYRIVSNDGSGRFSLGPIFPIGAGFRSFLDANGDGRLDMLTVSSFGSTHSSNQISLHSDIYGGLTTVTHATLTPPVAVNAIADFNGDGHLDLVGRPHGPGLYILKGN